MSFFTRSSWRCEQRVIYLKLWGVKLLNKKCKCGHLVSPPLSFPLNSFHVVYGCSLCNKLEIDSVFFKWLSLYQVILFVSYGTVNIHTHKEERTRFFRKISRVCNLICCIYVRLYSRSFKRVASYAFSLDGIMRLFTIRRQRVYYLSNYKVTILI